MRILYFDCFNGASGDMILGAFLDAGLPLDALREALGSLGVSDYHVEAERVLRAGVSATKFRLVERSPGREAEHRHAHGTHAHEHADHGHSHEPAHHGHSHEHAHHGAGPDDSHAHAHDAPGHPAIHDAEHAHGTAGPGAGHAHRSLREIRHLIDHSALPAQGKARARELFDRLAEAEASIHGMSVDRVHLHEVGALDSIIDVVGAVFAFEWARADRVVVSPLNVGGGTVRSAHGVFPVPAPATVRLLGDAPIYSRGPQAELLTPTGALLLTGYASAFGALPPLRIQHTGYGAGDRDFRDTPNVLRLMIGESIEASASERIVLLECEIDDMNPQMFGPLMDRLYEAGALEVYYAPVQMKKSRPGTLVTVLSSTDLRERLEGVLFAETTTIGVRYHEMQRTRLDREIAVVETPLGPVRFKIARRGGAVINASPEFDDCVRLARERQVPLKEVQALAIKAWLERQPD